MKKLKLNLINKKYIMTFMIAIFLMMISITNVSAMKFYTEDFNEYDLPNPDSVGTSRPNWFIAVNNDNTIYLYKSSSDFYVSGIGYASSVKFYYYKLVNNEWTYSSSNYVNVGYNVRYNSMKYVFTNNGIYSSSSKTDYAIAPGTGLTSYKSIKINYHGQACTKEENAIVDLIGIDFTDYIFDDNIYIYQISYDNENWNTIDISEVFNKSNYEYDLMISYNTTIYARVLNNQGDLVSSASYVVDDLSSFEGYYTYVLPKGYSFVFISNIPESGHIYTEEKDYNYGLYYYSIDTNYASDVNIVFSSFNNFRDYSYYFSLVNMSQNVLLFRRDNSDDDITIFVPNDSYVYFSKLDKNTDNTYKYDLEYKDSEGNIHKVTDNIFVKTEGLASEFEIHTGITLLDNMFNSLITPLFNKFPIIQQIRGLIELYTWDYDNDSPPEFYVNLDLTNLGIPLKVNEKMIDFRFYLEYRDYVFDFCKIIFAILTFIKIIHIIDHNESGSVT